MVFPLSAGPYLPKRILIVRQDDHNDDAWGAFLAGEALLLGLLGATLALFVAYPALRTSWELPELKLVLDTAIALASTLVAVLAGVRFSVEGRRLDLLLCCGFAVLAASTVAFGIAPLLGGQPLHRVEGWARLGGRLLGWSLIAYAPWARGRINARGRAMTNVLLILGLVLLVVWSVCRSLGDHLPAFHWAPGDGTPLALTSALAIQALLALLALVGFGSRFRARREDFDSWLALASTLVLFSELHYVFTPIVSSTTVSQGDFLKLLSYAVLLVGVWRAIRSAEFGRAVADERARVAREIHDGLAQYLFAVSTHASMLENGAPIEEMLPKLKEATAAAQQEARFAVLALSSAGGTAPFDAALRRYVEFLTADGRLAVDMEIDPAIRLAPDEQIEVFRIVQEGLANVRKHANATMARVRIGDRYGQRYVSVVDDGEGFDGQTRPAGQGLKNIRARAEAIQGGVTLRSRPGAGTRLEVLLRA
jgi:signal transduction histidine kinase